MSDDNFLAFQYAMGLLDEEQKQAIKKTQAFEETLLEWQLHLSRLNIQAPLEEESAQIIWQNVNAQIQQNLKSNKASIISTLLRYWRYILSSIASLGLLLSITLVNQTAHAQLGWDINTDLSKQKIFITTTTHQHLDHTNTCTLWVKKDNKVLLIGLMPETGKKTLDINEKTLTMLKGGEMIISFEDKDAPLPSKPTVIDYQGKWII
ncbi:MAG: hypothetical protein PSN35_05335 [Candidatus Thioglobus sp.]|uniref:hypothetical protein n=1 Tax=Candidatus Thioglobus sp. TaxID=2026721 RepID=UPI00262F42A7|nr:hypothetical protein [Candidatus Thioglobus sp.]MDC9727238.1 hypothetical protein [Candidatus Thioglobus sp.]